MELLHKERKKRNKNVYAHTLTCPTYILMQIIRDKTHTQNEGKEKKYWLRTRTAYTYATKNILAASRHLHGIVAASC